MPIVQANGIDINYEVQGEGEPVVLIPYLAADQACYAFQTAEYVKHFTCFTVDLRVPVHVRSPRSARQPLTQRAHRVSLLGNPRFYRVPSPPRSPGGPAAGSEAGGITGEQLTRATGIA